MKNIKSIQDFLILPDWIKVQLKMSEKSYSAYPFMTDEEEQNRKEKIYLIASHFSQISFEELTENPKYTLDDTWPYILEKFITPKLLGLLPIDFWSRFGFCFFCINWNGYKKMHYKILSKNKYKKIIPFSGKCKIRKSNDKRKILITNSFNCCNRWIPEKLFQQIFSIDIENFLKKNNFYNFEDYIYDLHNVNIWDYFFDKYSVEEVY
jgi:hypothetical protein